MCYTNKRNWTESREWRRRARSLYGRRLCAAVERKEEFWNFPMPRPQQVWSSRDLVDYFLSVFTWHDQPEGDRNQQVCWGCAILCSCATSTARLREGKCTDAAVMQVYLVIQIHVGLLKKQKISNYWSSDSHSLIWTPNYVMSSNQFQLFISCLTTSRQSAEKLQTWVLPMEKLNC